MRAKKIDTQDEIVLLEHQFDENSEVVLAWLPCKEEYVTWICWGCDSNGTENQYNWGNYFRSQLDAVKDYMDRIDNYTGIEKAWKERCEAKIKIYYYVRGDDEGKMYTELCKSERAMTGIYTLDDLARLDIEEHAPSGEEGDE